MTKRELLNLLAPYADDQYVCVLLRSKHCPQGAQTFIQGVTAFPPWYPGPDLIGLDAHEDNTEIGAGLPNSLVEEAAQKEIDADLLAGKPQPEPVPAHIRASEEAYRRGEWQSLDEVIEELRQEGPPAPDATAEAPRPHKPA